MVDAKPARSGLFASSSSWTSFASPLGKLKSVRQSGPIEPATPFTTTRNATQTPMTIQR